jgi:hypothetical protein
MVAVDLCTCGVMQLHFGALTLRMTPCAVTELVKTLGHALERHAGGGVCAPMASTLDATRRGSRGQA